MVKVKSSSCGVVVGWSNLIAVEKPPCIETNNWCKLKKEIFEKS